MKNLFITLLFLFVFNQAIAQQYFVDSFKHKLALTKDDTTKALLLDSLAALYLKYQPDSGFLYVRQGISLSQKIHYKYGEALGFMVIGSLLAVTGNYPKALESILNGVKISEEVQHRREVLLCIGYLYMGNCYGSMGDHKKQIAYYRQGLSIRKASGISDIDLFPIYESLAFAYYSINNLDSALLYAQKSYNGALQSKEFPWLVPYSIGLYGQILTKSGKMKEGMEYKQRALVLVKSYKDYNLETQMYNNLANIFNEAGHKDSAIYYAQQSLQLSRKLNFGSIALIADSILMHVYESEGKSDSALKYMKEMIAIKDSIFGQAKMLQFQLLAFDEEQRQRDIETAKEQLQDQIKLYSLLAILIVSLLIAFILWRNNRNKQKAYALLQKQKQETDTQKARVEKTLGELEVAKEQLENKNRDLEIEAALERIRTRTMAMQRSDELAETTFLLFQEFKNLGEVAARTFMATVNEENRMVDFWGTASDGTQLNKTFRSYIDKSSVVLQQYNLSKAQKPTTFEVTGEELRDYIHYLQEAGYPINENDIGRRRLYTVAGFSRGYMGFVTTDAPSQQKLQLLERFAGVFDQTYTRFLDLKKAEAQAREAQIEEALEKVRSRSLAMHNSNELQEVVNSVFERFKELEVELDTANILIFSEDAKDFVCWTANNQQMYSNRFHVPYADIAIINDLIKVKESGKELFAKSYTVDEKNQLFDYFFNYTDFKSIPEIRKKQILESNHYALSIAVIKNIGIQLTSYLKDSFSENENEILKRFAKVFHQAYIRFLDLQKAEAQAREAQIEAALEKVRARAMAMQKSEELTELVATVFQELTKLDLNLTRCFIYIIDEQSASYRIWMLNVEDQKTPVSFYVQFFDQPYIGAFLNAWKERKTKWVYHLKGDEKTAICDHLFSQTEVGRLPDIVKAGMRDPYGFFLSWAFFNFGGLQVDSIEPLPDASLDILSRFGKVFDLTYTRFNDLKQAEAQAKEARIETSLERVRAKAMAMHSSEDLVATISAFYHELELLNVKPRRCGVGLLGKESFIAEMFMSMIDDGNSKEVIVKIDLANHPVLRNIYEHWLKQQEYYLVLRDNELKEYLQLVGSQLSLPDYPGDIVQYGYFFYFTEGGFFAWTAKEMTEDDLKIYRRFTSVLSLTYKRYKDLKDAEARALVAIREASLNRIRAEIASMRTANDLQHITPSVWKELIVLGIPFFRCGVFIISEKEQLVHIYLSTPDGKPLAALHLDINNSDTTSNVAEYWRMQQVYCTHWDREQFAAWVQSLIGQGQITEATTYQAGEEPPESLTLQFVPFVQGMLYVGSAQPLTDTQIALVQALAEAFAVAYARYEDFSNLEVALTELKSTQAQLIQKEKMASLGELTAGIAHEIQNPLNFVNNFSEINTELIEELEQEISKGDMEEVHAIVNDLKENEQKIIHHGRRADSIVKGMLQHSRASTGKKELTDINALADECLRLSFHGLRAKDKEFKAEINTDLDTTIDKINIVPQDISRVLLNLFNNAFYAVIEKKKLLNGTYKPTVSVCTKREHDNITIIVKDNGNGIPQNIISKIFQPFFTTKPTGQGTGLGLSMSYDIIKAHGGEIKVDSPPAGQADKEGEGSEFVIRLPFKYNT